MISFMKKKTAPTLADLLPYLTFDRKRNLLWLKDGSASLTYRITPKHCLSLTDEDLETLRSALSDTLNQLPEGATLQFLLVREKSSEEWDQAANHWKREHPDPGGFPETEPRVALLYAKREQIRSQWREGLLYQSRVYLSIRIPPELDGSYGHRLGPVAFLASMRSKKEKKSPGGIEGEITALAEGMRLSLNAHGFETLGAKPEELIGFIYSYLNPERAKSIAAPEIREGQSLSEALGLTDLIETMDGLNLGRTRVRIGSLKSYPESSTPALMSGFAGECETFCLVYTILALSQTKEKERLSRKQRLATGMAGGNQVRDLHAESQLRDVEDTLSAMITSGEKLFASSIQLVTMAEDAPESKVAFNRLLESGERLGGGCQWFEETVGAYPVFFGILPFAPTFLTRPKRLLSANLSDFLPVYGIGPGHEEASVLFETPFRSLIGYSLFEKSPSGNAIVLGETGSGKSVFVSGLLLGMNAGFGDRAPAGFVVDVGNSFKRSVLYLGGSSIDFSPESGSVMNPFDLEPDQEEPDPEKVKFLTALFDEILGDRGVLSKLERALLETEILLYYAKTRERTFSGFKDHLENAEAPELKRLAKLLSLWCRPRPYGLLFDGKTNVDLTAPHLHFELKGCQRYPDLLRVAMLTMMEVIRRKIKERFPKRSFAIIDETHSLIRPAADGQPSSAARWFDSWFREMRKFGSSAAAISQTARDLKTPEVGDGIIANAPNRIILNQAGDEKTLREDLKLNDRELRDVFSLTQLRGSFAEVFIQSKSFRGVVLYRPTPLELWLCTTHPPDIALLDQEKKAHPEFNLHALMHHMAENYPGGAPENRTGAA